MKLCLVARVAGDCIWKQTEETLPSKCVAARVAVVGRFDCFGLLLGEKSMQEPVCWILPLQVHGCFGPFKTGNDIAIVLKRFLLQLQVTGLGSAGTFWLLVAGAAPCSGRLVGTEVVPWIRSPVAPPVRRVRCVCVRIGLGGSALQLRRAEEGHPCHRLCARSCKFA